MKFKMDIIDTFAIIRIQDEKLSLNFLNKKELTKYTENLITKQHHHIAIDFKNVKHIDTTGIGGLVKIYKLLMNKDGVFTIFNVNKKIQVTFQLTKLTKFLYIFSTENKFKEHYNLY